MSKGEKLVKSYHVSDVKEIVRDNFRQIIGVVLRETPGAQSEKKKENTYNPSVEVCYDSNHINI